MRRRQLLAGTTGAVGGLAGCINSALERRMTERSGGSGDDPDSDSDGAVTVGDPDDVPFLSAHPPHNLVLRNESDTERTAAVEITADRDESLLERDIDVPAGDTITAVLVEPRSYTISIRTSDPDGHSQSSTTVGIGRQPFDCTRSRTIVTLRETGIDTESVSRSTSCPEPQITDTSLEILEQDCTNRTEGSATIEFADEAVVVSGQIITPTPCHEPSIADAAYDDDRDVLTLIVDSGEQSSEVCADCLGVVDYEARLDLEGRYPDRVEVGHETRDERRQVATAAFSAADYRRETADR